MPPKKKRGRKPAKPAYVDAEEHIEEQLDSGHGLQTQSNLQEQQGVAYDEDDLPVTVPYSQVHENAPRHDYPEPPEPSTSFDAINAYPVPPTPGYSLPAPSGYPQGYSTVQNDQYPAIINNVYPSIEDESYPVPPVGAQIQEAPHPFVTQLQGNSFVPNYDEYDDFNDVGELDDDASGSERTDFLADSDDDENDADDIRGALGTAQAKAVAKANRKQDAQDEDYGSGSEDQGYSDDDDAVSEEDSDLEDEGAQQGRGAGRGRGRGRGRGVRGGAKKVMRKLNAKMNISSTTTRGRGRGRGRPRGRGRGQGRGVRKLAAVVDDDEDGRHRGGAKPGVRHVKAPDPALKSLQAEASELFIDGEYDRAEKILQQALASNPEQYNAHALLAEIYIATDQREKAAMSLFLGAYSNHRERDVWKRTANAIVERIGVDIPDAREFALHSFKHALALDRDDVELRRRRAKLLRDYNYLRRAANDHKLILQDYPCDADSLQALAEICSRRNWLDEAIPCFAAALPDGHDYDDDHECDEFYMDHANLLADLHLRRGATIEGLEDVKKFARHVLGRGDDIMWDNLDDDREFDANDDRREGIEGFISGAQPPEKYGLDIPLDLRMKLGIMRLRIGDEHLEEAKLHFSWLPTEEVDDDYIVEFSDLYLRIARNFFTTRHFDDALLYYETLKQSTFDGFTARDQENLARCYEECGLFDEAEEIYLAAAEGAPENDLTMIQKLSELFKNAGMEDRAIPYDETLAEGRRKKIRLDDYGRTPSPGSRQRNRTDNNQDPEMDIIEPLDEREVEEDDDDEEAIPMPEGDIPEVFQRQLERIGLTEDVPAKSGTTKVRRRRRMKRRLFTDYDTSQVESLFAELNVCEQRTDIDTPTKDTEWLGIASRLLSIFKGQKVFYPGNTHHRFWGYSDEARQRSLLSIPDQITLLKAIKQKEKDGIESNIPTDFCNFSFDRWFTIFLRSALILASQCKASKAYSTCDSCSTASVFLHDPERVTAVRNVKLVCALTLQDDETASYLAREYMKDQQFTGDAYRLFLATNLTLPEPNMMWNSSINQKFMLRQIKTMDAAMAPKAGTGHAHHSRRPFTRVDPETGEIIEPTELNVEILMLYAQMLYVGGSHSEALAYLHRVHALRPDDPMLCLTMALAYIGWAFKRQSSNRHYLIMQGLAMFERYREMRMEGCEKEQGVDLQQELQFNAGRLWHGLGLLHLSVPCYEKCLEMGEEMEGRGKEAPFTIEAAYTLRGIWAMNGQADEAERITERWLVL